MTKCILIMALAFFASASLAEPPVRFEKIQLSDRFFSEGAAAGDFNRDGRLDIVSGPYWYEGPEFKKSHAFFAPRPFDKLQYSNAFFAFVDDFNRDGWDDILIVGFPGADAAWFENPGGADGPWKRHLALQPVDNESPGYLDLTGDGKRELVCIHGQQFGYAAPDAADPTRPWTFCPVTPKGPYQRFTHGLGTGDVNGDGRPDLIEKDGWWEQPLERGAQGTWKHHPHPFAEAGAQMYAYDVNGDGKPDILTALHAHGYGLAWYEQVGRDGDVGFEKHLILPARAAASPAELSFSQLHALEVADLNGDGLKDLITGKRYWAHGDKGDPEPNAPAVLYWFELKRTPDGKAEFIPHLIDDDSGVGTMVLAQDLNGDGKPDLIVGNKKGTFVFLQK